ncbi:MAG: methionyl-tRNA formyltransferase, partial [Flavobacterium sp.]|nr:methionyl-tRNA formyltransferase [Flavobacterium sp.]
MKLGVLVSGNLGSIVLQNLVEHYQVEFVFTDSKSDSIIEFCSENNLNLFKGNPRNGKSKSFYENKPIDVLLSVNYLFIIESDLIRHPKILSFNIHGSLLPKYRGRTPHVWAIINNELKTGITAHLIDEGCDTGDIIEQVEIPILPNDTGADLLDKFNKLYIILVQNVLYKISTNEVVRKKQDDKLATYFGKRTPDDGRINWQWQKERIFNWVRAQSAPYPGAFTYYLDQKITIDQLEFSDAGFDYKMTNGLILSVSPLLIKAENGVVEVVTCRNDLSKLSVGEI